MNTGMHANGDRGASTDGEAGAGTTAGWPKGGRRPAGILIATLLAGLLLAHPAQALPTFEAVRTGHQPSESLLLDRHGEIIHRLRTRTAERRGRWTRLEEMSAVLHQALLLSEDRRFHQHAGIDWQAIPAAAWANLWNRQSRGASTLSMQLVALLDPSLQRGNQPRPLARKLAQAAAARRLEQGWQKHQILEAYLNLVPFRGELVGIDALARTLFGRAPHALDAREAALAAVLVRAPNAPAERVAARACALLARMQPAAGATAAPHCLAIEIFARSALRQRHWPASEGIAPHLARRLLGHGDAAPAILRSSIDARLQRLARESLRRQLRELAGRQVEDGAVLVLDNASGEVRAWVGSSGALSRAAEVDGVTALRQPGSTLKPFLYAQAIAERRLTAASLLDDSPAQIATSGGLYMPQNHDRRFKGWVSVRTALAASLNVPAVRTLEMVSPEAFHRQLQQLGLKLPHGGGHYGYSLALGSADTSLLQLANAYRTLANGGRHCPVRGLVPTPPAAMPATPATSATSTTSAIPATPAHEPAAAAAAAATVTVTAAPPATAAVTGGAHDDCRQVLDPGAAFIIADILSDRHARAPTFGSDSVLDTRRWSAVKTGTSKDMRDNWAVGWDARHTVAVWVGNADGQPMHDVVGTSGAAPIWATLMRHLQAQAPSVAPTAPAGLQRQRVSFGQQREAARDEWFLPGTAQSRFAADAADDARQGGDAPLPATTGAAAAEVSIASGAALAQARIVRPVDGSIIALDPDIPPVHQRLRLQARLPAGQAGAAGSGLRWLLLRGRADALPIARGSHAGWLPLPGRHRLQLRDAAGRVLDEIGIEVRGATASDAPVPHSGHRRRRSAPAASVPPA